MTKKPKATEAEAADLEPEDAAQIEPEAAAPEVEPAADSIDDDGVEAEEVADEPLTEPQAEPLAAAEGNQPDAQPGLADAGADATAGDQSLDPTAQIEPDVVTAEVEPTAEQLQQLADRIHEMLAWHRNELLVELVNHHGLVINRSIEGATITMAGITASGFNTGPTGDHYALENWAMAARRQILEMQAVTHD